MVKGGRVPSLTVSIGDRATLVTTDHALSIGRDASSGALLSDERASRRHALVRVENGVWIYEDLASTNGSFVDGVRVSRLLLDRERVVRVGNAMTGELIRLTPEVIPRAIHIPLSPAAAAGLLASVVLILGAAGVVSGAFSTNASASASAAPATTAAASSVVLTTSDVASVGRASTVRIVQGNGLGSGVYLGSGRVLTAAHVVPTTATIVVSFAERQVGTARVIRRDESDDLALLEVAGLDGAGAKAIVWGDSSALRQGDTLIALGYPAGLPLSVKAGVVSGLRVEGTTDLIQTDASLNPGMSGGPVLDSAGHLVGITDFGLTKYPGLNFAVASTTARAFVEGR